MPGAGDASLLAAGTLAGEGRLNVWAVLLIAMAAWMLGSAIGYAIGVRQGRSLLERPGWLERSRQNLLVKGDDLFGRHSFLGSDDDAGVRVRDLPGAVRRVHAGERWQPASSGSASTWCCRTSSAPRSLQAVGNAGTTVIFGAVVVVALGLAIRAGFARWRRPRPARL